MPPPPLAPPPAATAAATAAAVAAARALIETSPAIPSLAALAAATGCPAARLLREFRAATGLTPRSYAESVHARRRQAAAAAPAPPGRRRQDCETTHLARAESLRGPVLLGLTPAGICFLGFGEPPEALEGDLRRRFPRARLAPAPATAAEALLAAVCGFLAAPRAALDLPLDLRGTPFQRRVWEALRRIPLGETRSYGGLAAELGCPAAVRAVARACARNPVSLLVPCHRMLGRDGDLTGYRWGLAQKRALLMAERSGGDGRADPLRFTAT